MNGYQIEGDFQMGRIRQHFVLQVAAVGEKEAKEAVLANLGSRHGVSRRQIQIASTKKIKADEVTDPVAKTRLKA